MAASKRVKRREGENLTPQAIEKVISLLTQEKPITKKEACERLNIPYNTTRLTKIIDEYNYDKEQDEKRRAANRGKPASDQEIKDVITWYLDGDTITDISDRLYRSTTFVRNIIDTVGVPQRGTGETYANFSPLPEQCISDSFEVGEIAWSSRYQGPCIIEKQQGYTADKLAKVYQIYVVESDFELKPEERFFETWGKPGFYASQPAYDLGSLQHLKKYGVDVARKINGPGTRTSNN